MHVCVTGADSDGSLRGINREQSVEVIHLDVLRTFPTLGFFQEVGLFEFAKSVKVHHFMRKAEIHALRNKIRGWCESALCA